MEILPIPLYPGQKITLYSISDMMATTTQVEATVMELLPVPEFRPSYVSQNPALNGNWRVGGVRVKGKRTLTYLTIRPAKDLVIPGWGNLQSDIQEHGSFTGNACLNIAGSVEQIHQLVEKNINPHFKAYDIIMSAEKPWTEGPYVPVYPESPTQHAVVQRMREEVSQ